MCHGVQGFHPVTAVVPLNLREGRGGILMIEKNDKSLVIIAADRAIIMFIVRCSHERAAN